MHPGLDIIDWSEFTGRSAPALNTAEFRESLQGKRVLITGAGGFIGSALARTLAPLNPALVIALDHAEAGIHELQLAVAEANASKPYRFLIGSIGDSSLLRELFAQYQPEIVFHAAACKHVPLMEENPLAAAWTNIVGTHCLLDAVAHNGTKQFILLSTDKAVEPISVMGATKRVAELLTLRNNNAGCRYKVVRLGNVLGSTGSVGPRFMQQIARGGPMTVTDPEVTRYFLTVEESVQLLLSSLTISGPSTLLIPKLSDPYRIVDLANFLIDRVPQTEKRPQIVHTGLRPGDRLNEKLTASFERCTPTSNPGLLAVEAALPDATVVSRATSHIEDAIIRRNRTTLLSALQSLLPEYEPSVRLLETAAKILQTA